MSDSLVSLLQHIKAKKSETHIIFLGGSVGSAGDDVADASHAARCEQSPHALAEEVFDVNLRQDCDRARAMIGDVLPFAREHDLHKPLFAVLASAFAPKDLDAAINAAAELEWLATNKHEAASGQADPMGSNIKGYTLAPGMEVQRGESRVRITSRKCWRLLETLRENGYSIPAANVMHRQSDAIWQKMFTQGSRETIQAALRRWSSTLSEAGIVLKLVGDDIVAEIRPMRT